MRPLETRRACELAEDSTAAPRWLVEELWAEQGVGIVGGEPKSCKSFLALDLAVAVAGGRPCLRRFAVKEPGPVLLYNAEDSPRVVRERLEGLARAAGCALERLELHVITEPGLRLDRDLDCARLSATVQALRPRLLILDPFVRLHRIDENHSSEVAPMLAYLRELQRTCSVAVALVHHARKGGGRGRAGQELRGSSELHAWGDSNLYLRRRKERLLLSVEHRAAPGHEGWELKLRESGAALALEAVAVADPSGDGGDEAQDSPSSRILRALAEASAPLSVLSLRALCRMRTQTVSRTLNKLVRRGLVQHTRDGYQAVPDARDRFLSRRPLGGTGKGNGKDTDSPPAERNPIHHEA